MKTTVIHRRTRLPAAGKLLIAGLLLGFHTPAATAHLVLDMLERPTPQLVRDAFSTPYGRLNVAKFGKALREARTPSACAPHESTPPLWRRAAGYS